VLRHWHNAGTASLDYLSTVSGGGYIGSWLCLISALACIAQQQPESSDAAYRHPPSRPRSRGCDASNHHAASGFYPRFSDVAATRLRNVGLNLIVLLSVQAGLLAPPLLLEPLPEATHCCRAIGFAATWIAPCS
jgi:hypothetical protein